MPQPGLIQSVLPDQYNWLWSFHEERQRSVAASAPHKGFCGNWFLQLFNPLSLLTLKCRQVVRPCCIRTAELIVETFDSADLDPLQLGRALRRQGKKSHSRGLLLLPLSQCCCSRDSGSSTFRLLNRISAFRQHDIVHCLTFSQLA